MLESSEHSSSSQFGLECVVLKVLCRVMRDLIVNAAMENTSAQILERYEQPEKVELLQCFDCVEVPTISIRKFLHAVRKACSEEEFILACVLVDRLLFKCGILLTEYNVHRLFLTAAMISVKVTRNTMGITQTLSNMSSCTPAEMCWMERTFLSWLDWDIHVTNRQYQRLVSQAAATQRCRWCGPGIIRRDVGTRKSTVKSVRGLQYMAKYNAAIRPFPQTPGHTPHKPATPPDGLPHPRGGRVSRTGI
eukprot:Hpha_TRINITY_DN15290_c5_g1::TRINITY_DN15290_c5_g1_i1::g.64835::m.64835